MSILLVATLAVVLITLPFAMGQDPALAHPPNPIHVDKRYGVFVSPGIELFTGDVIVLTVEDVSPIDDLPIFNVWGFDQDGVIRCNDPLAALAQEELDPSLQTVINPHTNVYYQDYGFTPPDYGYSQQNTRVSWAPSLTNMFVVNVVDGRLGLFSLSPVVVFPSGPRYIAAAPFQQRSGVANEVGTHTWLNDGMHHLSIHSFFPSSNPMYAFSSEAYPMYAQYGPDGEPYISYSSTESKMYIRASSRHGFCACSNGYVKCPYSPHPTASFAPQPGLLDPIFSQFRVTKIPSPVVQKLMENYNSAISQGFPRTFIILGQLPFTDRVDAIHFHGGEAMISTRRLHLGQTRLTTRGSRLTQQSTLALRSLIADTIRFTFSIQFVMEPEFTIASTPTIIEPLSHNMAKNDKKVVMNIRHRKTPTSTDEAIQSDDFGEPVPLEDFIQAYRQPPSQMQANDDISSHDAPLQFNSNSTSTEDADTLRRRIDEISILRKFFSFQSAEGQQDLAHGPASPPHTSHAFFSERAIMSTVLPSFDWITGREDLFNIFNQIYSTSPSPDSVTDLVKRNAQRSKAQTPRNNDELATGELVKDKSTEPLLSHSQYHNHNVLSLDHVFGLQSSAQASSDSVMRRTGDQRQTYSHSKHRQPVHLEPSIAKPRLEFLYPLAASAELSPVQPTSFTAGTPSSIQVYKPMTVLSTNHLEQDTIASHPPLHLPFEQRFSGHSELHNIMSLTLLDHTQQSTSLPPQNPSQHHPTRATARPSRFASSSAELLHLNHTIRYHPFSKVYNLLNGGKFGKIAEGSEQGEVRDSWNDTGLSIGEMSGDPRFINVSQLSSSQRQTASLIDLVHRHDFSIMSSFAAPPTQAAHLGAEASSGFPVSSHHSPPLQPQHRHTPMATLQHPDTPPLSTTNEEESNYGLKTPTFFQVPIDTDSNAGVGDTGPSTGLSPHQAVTIPMETDPPGDDESLTTFPSPFSSLRHFETMQVFGDAIAAVGLLPRVFLLLGFDFEYGTVMEFAGSYSMTAPSSASMVGHVIQHVGYSSMPFSLDLVRGEYFWPAQWVADMHLPTSLEQLASVAGFSSFFGTADDRLSSFVWDEPISLMIDPRMTLFSNQSPAQDAHALEPNTAEDHSDREKPTHSRSAAAGEWYKRCQAQTIPSLLINPQLVTAGLALNMTHSPTGSVPLQWADYVTPSSSPSKSALFKPTLPQSKPGSRTTLSSNGCGTAIVHNSIAKTGIRQEELFETASIHTNPRATHSTLQNISCDDHNIRLLENLFDKITLQKFNIERSIYSVTNPLGLLHPAMELHHFVITGEYTATNTLFIDYILERVV